MSKLFEPAQAGALKLKNRITMAPLTRSRAAIDGVPTDMHREYYEQRASAGLVVTEGTFFEDVNRAFLGQPGISTDEQVAGWRKVADAVHAAGGTIVMQIMHGGRLTLPSINFGETAQAPSAIAPGTTLHGADGREEVATPRALELDEIPGIIKGFADAASRAVHEAGMDGVEIHSANGYLLHQFLAPNANERADEYGVTPENRARLTVEVVRTVAEAIGADRTALRISPEHNVQGALETETEDLKATYTALLEGIRDLDIAYLSILHKDIDGELVAYLRETFGGFTVLNSGFGSYTGFEEAQQIIDGNLADAVAVGREIIANPDLVRRWQEQLEMNEANESTFYTPGPQGYTDYPFAN